LTRYSANAFIVVSSLFMTPPSKLECDAPVLGLYGPVFIQVGGDHGLAQNRMLDFTAWAALMYGMSLILSRSIENMLIDVSPAVSFNEYRSIA
jgi:hypothetical protein